MATAWELLLDGSTLSSGTAWELLNNLGGGGGVVYIDRWHIEVPVEVEMEELAVTVQSDDLQSLAIIDEDLEVAVSFEEEGVSVEAGDEEIDVSTCS